MSKKKRIKSAVIFCLFFHASNVWGMDIPKIIEIESAGNPLAHNAREDARGLMQIRPLVLREWNNYHYGKRYTAVQLFNAEINKKIGTWYIEQRIPQLLRHFNIPVTDKGRIIAYNAGISTAIRYYREGKALPKITENYLKKYFKD